MISRWSRDIIKRRKQGHDLASLQPIAKVEDELYGLKYADLMEDDDLEDFLD